MEAKKEVQVTITPASSNGPGKVSEDEFYSILKTISPGTNFRSALDNAVKVGKGALIAVESDSLLQILDGGFRVNCRFTPQRLSELVKMDGAIILSKDMKRINHANVLLTPDSKIKTHETGTRHKAAERTAKQTGTLVIAISERKHDIHLFYKNIKYHVRNTEELLRKASTYVQMLEKQRELFDMYVDKLNRLELRNYHSLNQAVSVIQKGKLIQRMSEDLKKYIFELGTEGLILKIRMKEIVTGVEKETNLVVKDYSLLDPKKSKVLLDELSYDEILDHGKILQILSSDSANNNLNVKGWRVLSRTSLSEAEIAKLLKDKGSLGATIHSNIQSYAHILGEDKAKKFKDEIERIKLNP
ncbi:MAG: DNA integrity scanning diadenylate cyclase DisA [Nanoarchaeota archaeon]|nr:DNA integrity scanning diadenylate cyclase DisA [Nanoarchaeota archaeon]